ncbi:MAG: RHS repeat-associated core domain-containing protein [Planctomycetaceae bacterium]|jgi:RHS repeat-associated protein|nr:RHS repeat-associated core domain-containing protein [Planctomycetaceae bacterium]
MLKKFGLSEQFYTSGNAIGFDPATALTEFLYSGEQFDSKIGQQYLRQRYYDPTTGRFNRLDPFFGNLSDPQSLHKYLYTHADPINWIDPSGLFSLGGFVGNLGSMQMTISMVNAGTRTISLVYRVVDAYQKISTIIDLAQTVSRVMMTVSQTPGLDGLVQSLFNELARQFKTAGGNGINTYLHMATQAIQQMKQELQDDWWEIAKAIGNKAGDIAQNIANFYTSNPGRIASYLANKDLKLILYLPTGPLNAGTDRITDTKINIGKEIQLAFSPTGGRLFGFGLLTKEAKPPMKSDFEDQIVRIDWFCPPSSPHVARHGTPIVVHYHPINDFRSHDQKYEIWYR